MNGINMNTGLAEDTRVQTIGFRQISQTENTEHAGNSYKMWT
jgi:hypothetical protein